MWCMLALLYMGKNLISVRRLYSLVLSISCSATLWAIVNRLFIHAPLMLLLITWIAISIYALRLAKYLTKEVLIPPSFWPAKPWAGLIAVTVYIVGLVIHAGLNHHLHKPFDIQGWTSATWMLAAFLVFYPKTIEEPLVQFKRSHMALLLLFCPVILHIQHCRYVRFEDLLYTNPGEITEKAFTRGFTDLGVKSVICQTLQLAGTHWQEAVRLQRSAWRYEDKFSFAKAFQKHPVLQKNAFLFTVMYGCDLQLFKNIPIGVKNAPPEEALGMLSRAEKQEIYILTSASLLQINSKGITAVWNTGGQPIALCGAANQDQIGILMNLNQVLLYSTSFSYPILYLPDDGTWKDIQLSADGETVYAMSGNGRVETYRYTKEKKIWEHQKTITIPLWNTMEMAKRILLAPDETGVLLLDKCGGIAWFGDQSKYKNYTGEIRNRYYDPLAPEMNVFVFWKNQILLGNIFGRIHFLNPDEKGFPAPVRADMYFNTGKARWDYRANAVDFAPIPEIGTILQLYKNGSINAIVMPQRYRIEHKGKAFKKTVGSG